MTQKVTYIIELLDRFSAQARKIKESVEAMQSRMMFAAQATRSFGSSWQLAFGAAQLKALDRFGNKINTRVSLPLAAAAFSMLHAHQQLQTLQAGFEGMLGGTKPAASFVKSLQMWAQKTPFELRDVMKASTQMVAAMIPPKQILKDLQVMGNLAAMTGAHVDDMATEISKVRIRGRMYLMDMKIFASHGINIFQMLMDHLQLAGHRMGVTRVQLNKLFSQGAITFPIMMAALSAMTKKGGVGFNQMTLHTNTLLGAWRRFNDARFQLFAKFGQDIDRNWGVTYSLQAMAGAMFHLANTFKTFRASHGYLLKFIEDLALLLIILGPVLKAITMIGEGILFLFKPSIWVIRQLVIAMRMLEIAMIPLDGLLAAIVAAGLITWGVVYIFQHWREEVKYLKSELKDLYAFLRHPISYMGAVQKKTFESGLSKEEFGSFGAAYLSPVGVHSKSHITLNVNDPTDKIHSIHSKHTGDAKLSVGKNMDHTGD